MGAPTGRPEPGEYAPYAGDDFAWVPEDDALAALEGALQGTLERLRPLSDARVAGVRYADGKWTIKEIVGHLADDERIFLYRALCVARGEPRPLPGFDENAYMAAAQFEQRDLHDLLDEVEATRRASIAFFAGLPVDAWLRAGDVNGYRATVRGLAFHIAAHERHHHRVLDARYLPLLG
ncbi:MAG: DinB family protein [Acidobacteriota bacterium]